jgi:hypothetical protein
MLFAGRGKPAAVDSWLHNKRHTKKKKEYSRTGKKRTHENVR